MNLADPQLGPGMQCALIICLSELQMARPLVEVFRARLDDIELIQSRSAKRTWREKREWPAAFFIEQ